MVEDRVIRTAQSRRSLELEIAWALRRAEEAKERLRQLPSRHWDLGDGTVTE